MVTGFSVQNQNFTGNGKESSTISRAESQSQSDCHRQLVAVSSAKLVKIFCGIIVNQLLPVPIQMVLQNGQHAG